MTFGTYLARPGGEADGSWRKVSSGARRLDSVLLLSRRSRITPAECVSSIIDLLRLISQRNIVEVYNMSALFDDAERFEAHIVVGDTVRHVKDGTEQHVGPGTYR